MKFRGFLAVLCIIGLAVSSASALDVQIDFGPTAMTGWDGWNCVGGSKTSGGVDFFLDKANQPNGPTIRSDYDPGDNLIGDALSSGDPGSGGMYTLTITNLVADTYDLVTYFNKPTSDHTAGTQTQSIDGGAAASVSASDQEDVFTDAGKIEAQFTSTGVSDVITVVWGNSGGSENWVCGFQLTPEPATVALLAFGALLLRRRK